MIVSFTVFSMKQNAIAPLTHRIVFIQEIINSYFLSYPLSFQSKDGKTPLHMAATHGRFSCSQALIQNGKSPNINTLSEQFFSLTIRIPIYYILLYKIKCQYIFLKCKKQCTNEILIIMVIWWHQWPNVFDRSTWTQNN